MNVATMIIAFVAVRNAARECAYHNLNMQTVRKAEIAKRISTPPPPLGKSFLPAGPAEGV